MRTKPTKLPPVIILGGDPNALSVARSLGRRGIRVYTVNEPDVPVRYSRFCRYLQAPWLGSNKASWTAFLLGPQTDSLRGAVLLAASDEALEIVCDNRRRLAKRFLLDESNAHAQRAMLDKLSTYRAAQDAGVPMPRCWFTGGERTLGELAPELVYPLLVKPLSSYRFGSKFGGKKFFVANDFNALREGVDKARAVSVDVLLMEMIPGPDDRLCSYYTYLDQAGNPQYHFTKRVIRRFPVGMGNGCYHITDRNPALRDLALRLFRHVGLRGLANAEFKWDERDGQFKLIECNARFTAADCLLAKSGFDLASFVYNRLVGLPQKPLDKYRTGLRLWYATQDFQAFLELRRQKQLTLWGWLSSVAKSQTFPYFELDDPLPSAARWLRFLKLEALYHNVGHLLKRRLMKCFAWLRPLARQSVETRVPPREITTGSALDEAR